MDGGDGSGFKLPGIPREINDTINTVLNDPRIQQAKEFAGSLMNKGNEMKQGLIDSAVKAGYLSKEGKFEGAAKSQALNFLSDMIPMFPGMTQKNKLETEMFLSSIGLNREQAAAGHASSKAMLTDVSSGIDKAHHVGALQVNKMSADTRGYFMDKVISGLTNGTLKSGDVIDSYDLPDNSPIRREQGGVRFYISPDGKPYLLDTYGVDPHKVKLGAAQAKYDQTVKKFQSGQGMVGRIAKMFNIKPMSDAAEAGDKIQLLLGIRNKLVGYDPRAEADREGGQWHYRTH